MLEQLERVAELNERFVLDPWEMRVKPVLKKHKQTIITVAVVGAAAYFGAVFGVKHTKVEVNIVPREGTIIPLKIVENPYN